MRTIGGALRKSYVRKMTDFGKVMGVCAAATKEFLLNPPDQDNAGSGADNMATRKAAANIDILFEEWTHSSNAKAPEQSGAFPFKDACRGRRRQVSGSNDDLSAGAGPLNLPKSRR
jgi:hypothetical protein